MQAAAWNGATNVISATHQERGTRKGYNPVDPISPSTGPPATNSINAAASRRRRVIKESRHEQWMREKEEATMVVNRNKDLDSEAERQRMINIAGEALGFSPYQRDKDTVEVLAHHTKRLGEELAAVKGDLVNSKGWVQC